MFGQRTSTTAKYWLSVAMAPVMSLFTCWATAKLKTSQIISWLSGYVKMATWVGMLWTRQRTQASVACCPSSAPKACDAFPIRALGKAKEVCIQDSQVQMSFTFVVKSYQEALGIPQLHLQHGQCVRDSEVVLPAGRRRAKEKKIFKRQRKLQLPIFSSPTGSMEKELR